MKSPSSSACCISSTRLRSHVGWQGKCTHQSYAILQCLRYVQINLMSRFSALGLSFPGGLAEQMYKSTFYHAPVPKVYHSQVGWQSKCTNQPFITLQCLRFIIPRWAGRANVQFNLISQFYSYGLSFPGRLERANIPSNLILRFSASGLSFPGRLAGQTYKSMSCFSALGLGVCAGFKCKEARTVLLTGTEWKVKAGRCLEFKCKEVRTIPFIDTEGKVEVGRCAMFKCKQGQDNSIYRHWGESVDRAVFHV